MSSEAHQKRISSIMAEEFELLMTTLVERRKDRLSNAIDIKCKQAIVSAFDAIEMELKECVELAKEDAQ